MSKALAPSALREKYAAMMAEQGAAHPGQVYDPVFDWWLPEIEREALERFLDEGIVRTYGAAQAVLGAHQAQLAQEREEGSRDGQALSAQPQATEARPE